MKQKTILALLVAGLMALAVIPISDLSADDGEELIKGHSGPIESAFLFYSEPDQATFDKYISSSDYTASMVAYDLGLYSFMYDYDVEMTDIIVGFTTFLQTYEFDTDEAGIEQYLTHAYYLSAHMKITATVREQYSGYSLFTKYLVGDVDGLENAVGTVVNEGDKIVVDVDYTFYEYQSYDETDMLRDDGKYLIDSWDVLHAYSDLVIGDVSFYIGGKVIEADISAYNAESYVTICSWYPEKPISEVEVGDAFEFDRNNRVIYNSHFTDYTIGEGEYVVSDTQTTTTMYTDEEYVYSESYFSTYDAMSDPDYLFEMFFGYDCETMSKVGTVSQDYDAAVYLVTSFYLNAICGYDISIFSEDYVEYLQEQLDVTKKVADENFIIICILAVFSAIALIAFAMYKSR